MRNNCSVSWSHRLALGRYIEVEAGGVMNREGGLTIREIHVSCIQVRGGLVRWALFEAVIQPRRAESRRKYHHDPSVEPANKYRLTVLDTKNEKKREGTYRWLVCTMLSKQRGKRTGPKEGQGVFMAMDFEGPLAFLLISPARHFPDKSKKMKYKLSIQAVYLVVPFFLVML